MTDTTNEHVKAIRSLAEPWVDHLRPAMEDDNNYYRGRCDIDGKDAAEIGESFQECIHHADALATENDFLRSEIVQLKRTLGEERQVIDAFAGRIEDMKQSLSDANARAEKLRIERDALRDAGLVDMRRYARAVELKWWNEVNDRANGHPDTENLVEDLRAAYGVAGLMDAAPGDTAEEGD